jgi:hypothetical protein
VISYTENFERQDKSLSNTHAKLRKLLLEKDQKSLDIKPLVKIAVANN